MIEETRKQMTKAYKINGLKGKIDFASRIQYVRIATALDHNKPNLNTKILKHSKMSAIVSVIVT